MPGVQHLSVTKSAAGDGLLHPSGQGGSVGNGRQPDRLGGGGAQITAGLRPQPGLLALGGDLGRRRIAFGQRARDVPMRRLTRGGRQRVNDMGAQEIVLQGIACVGLVYETAGEQLGQRHATLDGARGGPLVQIDFAREERRARQPLAGAGRQGGETADIQLGKPGQGGPDCYRGPMLADQVTNPDLSGVWFGCIQP